MLSYLNQCQITITLLPDLVLSSVLFMWNPAVPLILGKVIFGIVSTIRGKSRTPEEMEWAVDNSAITDGYK